jgi:hypothetical protein
MTPNEYLHSVVKSLDAKFDNSYMMAEVGTDTGTTAAWTLRAIRPGRLFHTIDPYGGKPYNIDDQLYNTFDYDDKKYRQTMSFVSMLANQLGITWTHWKMRSQDWVKMFDNIQWWADGKVQEPKFCWAYLDGEHAWEPILIEFEYFYDRMPSGAVICVDDYNLLPEGSIPSKLGKFKGKIELKTDDDHFRIYFTKD